MPSMFKVVVIGAGPSGFAAAKYLQAEENLQVTVHAGKPGPGGVWYHTYSRDPTEIPQDPFTDPYDHLAIPMYDDLDTNVPRAMMEFSDHSWDPETPLFPRREAVQGYLQDYMKGLEKLIVFDTEVIDVHHRITEEGRKWVIETRNVHLPKVNKVEYFDYVVVATGNFGKPWVPMIPGLREWADTYPKSVLHAKSYKNPESFAGRKLLVVGNGSSGQGISLQLQGRAQRVLASQQTEGARLSHPNHIRLPGIKAFDPGSQKVEFEGEHIEVGIDKTIICTGYDYSFPFLTRNQNDRSLLFPNGPRVKGLYDHMFYIRNPGLAFVGVPKMAASFLLPEAQSAMIARYFTGRIPLPSKKDMNESEQDEVTRWQSAKLSGTAIERSFHDMPGGRDKQYIPRLNSKSIEADQRIGKPPPHWVLHMDWTRDNLAGIRNAFFALEEDKRQRINKVELLGLSWREPK